jgi:type VII secretion-associated serine protease mycosin
MLTAARRVRQGAAGLLAMTAALAVMMIMAAGPARAQGVRSAEQWVLNAINVAPAWQQTQGQGVTVAVIDSGVVPDVSDLAGSVITGPDYTGVGTPPTSPDWGIHGTWMASLIAGHGHDGDNGIIGVAPRSRVLSIRVITDMADPGYARYEHEPLSRSWHQLAEAIRYAVAHGASVISMSLGYSTASRPVRLALQDALNHGVVVVASSGNSGDTAGADGQGHAPYSYPANYPGVLGVAAVDRAGAPASFSSENLSVQVAAPGVKVPAQGNDGQYWLVSGTSPACALTAGVAALIKSSYPHLSPALVRLAITSTTRTRPPGGYDDLVGFGTVDAAAALSAAGKLAAPPPAQHGLLAAHLFGGGPAAVPAVPIGQRGIRSLVLLGLLGAGCLVLTAAAGWRLRPARRGLGPDAGPGGQITAEASPPGWDETTDSDARTPVPRLRWQSGRAGRHAAQPGRTGAPEAGE